MKTYLIPKLDVLNYASDEYAMKDFLRLELSDEDAASGMVKVSSAPSGLSYDSGLGAFVVPV
jgi:hypothetical protein